MNQRLAVIETTSGNMPTPESMMAEARAEKVHRKMLCATYYMSVIRVLRYEKGFSVRMIAEWLAERGVDVSGQGVYTILQRDRVRRRALEVQQQVRLAGEAI